MIYTILGAGLSGISTADHLSRKGIHYKLYEGKGHGGGHIHSEVIDGFTWDEGPHISFTAYDYVREYFSQNCGGRYLEYATNPTNYFKSNWIQHPAQSHLYAVPEPLRSDCVADIQAIRNELPLDYQAHNYQEWIDYAFGKTFARVFPKVYTEKYWTTAPENLSTDWIGKRIYFPAITDMVESARGPIEKQTHYISTVRYPEKGGYYSFIKKVEDGLNIDYQKKLSHISFARKELLFEDGEKVTYERLINTLPLPQLIRNSDAPGHIRQQASKLKCSQALIVNVIANHPAPVNNHWIYVYDEDYYATRINFTELLAPANGLEGKTGIQVEVYFSDYHPLREDPDKVAKNVIRELIAMRLLQDESSVDSYHTRWLDWANVIFDRQRESAQEAVFNWLAKMGMQREADDLSPMTDWNVKAPEFLGEIIMAGRFAQWKYYWTDDCVMRGKYIADQIDGPC